METRNGRNLTLQEVTQVLASTPKPGSLLVSWFEPHYDNIVTAVTFHKPHIFIEGKKFVLNKVAKCTHDDMSAASCGGEYTLSPCEGYTPMTRFCATKMLRVVNHESTKIS